jgi:transcriptional regulator with XRE-family HTH domain
VDGRLQRVIGVNLRAYRQERGLSQEAFADVLGVHRTYLGGIERGEHNLTMRSLERLAAKIDIDPMVLLCTDRGAQSADRPPQNGEKRTRRAQVRG